MANKNKEFEVLVKRRPHVVILGAGASIAAIPNGDKNGRKISAMQGFIKNFGLDEVLKSVNLITKSDNLEDIYLELYSNPENTSICTELNQKIYNSLSMFEIPEEPTIYDYLLSSLTKKDLIATFNWDPLLLQAYQRVARRITKNLPDIVFLHGNVLVGHCEDCKIVGTTINGTRCIKCNKNFSKLELLYPISNKNYTNNKVIKHFWEILSSKIKQAYMFTIFGYGAPKTDQAAIKILQEAWGDVGSRMLEEIEFIDIKDEKELIETWRGFIHTHHYKVHKNFFSSSLGLFPRRTCEANFDMLMNCVFHDDTKGFKENMTFEEMSMLLKDLFVDEEKSNEMLLNTYRDDYTP
jgi:hypothetical protein